VGSTSSLVSVGVVASEEIGFSPKTSTGGSIAEPVGTSDTAGPSSAFSCVVSGTSGWSDIEDSGKLFGSVG
jgi:hypothetical protein